MSLPLILTGLATGYADHGCYGSPQSGDSVLDANYVKHSVLCTIVPLDGAGNSTGNKTAVYSNDVTASGQPISCQYGVYAVTNLRPELINGTWVLSGTWFVNNGNPSAKVPNAITPNTGYIAPAGVGPRLTGGATPPPPPPPPVPTGHGVEIRILGSNSSDVSVTDF